MKRKLVILIIVLSVIASGCSHSNKPSEDTDTEVVNYTYKGENDFWKVEFSVNAEKTFKKEDGVLKYESHSDEKLTATYRKDLSGLASMKNLVLSYKSSVGGGELNENFTDTPPTNKTFTISSASSGGALESEDEVIEVNITIDGITQTIELENDN